MKHTDIVLQLPIPNLPELNDMEMSVEKLSEDKDLIETLEETVEKWSLQLTNALEASNSKVIHIPNEKIIF